MQTNSICIRDGLLPAFFLNFLHFRGDSRASWQGKDTSEQDKLRWKEGPRCGFEILQSEGPFHYICCSVTHRTFRPRCRYSIDGKIGYFGVGAQNSVFWLGGKEHSITCPPSDRNPNKNNPVTDLVGFTILVNIAHIGPALCDSDRSWPFFGIADDGLGKDD